jgi:hypothetical protein
MLTFQQIEEAKDWLDVQRQVKTPGPMQTIREALEVYLAILRQKEAEKITPCVRRDPFTPMIP